jgi:hypothetical protein
MSRARFFLAPLALLIIVGLLILGGFAIHRTGWAQGYRMGQMAAGITDGAVVPYVPYGPGSGGLLITLVVFLLLLLVAGKFFRFWAWRMAWGPWMGRHSSKDWHWHRGHGPMPPWYQYWEEPRKERAEESEPSADASAPGAQV